MGESLSLTYEEAVARAELLAVERYDLEFDLTGLLGGDELWTISTIRFSCRTPGAETFVECLGEIQEASLNGRALDGGFPPGGRLALSGLQADNVLTVRSVQRDTGSGRGVHRAVDAQDQSVYVWTSFEPDDARVAFACFDQPDLKAVFGIEVVAPAEWTVVSNSGRAEVTDAGEHRRWAFPDTPVLSTYLPVLNAGPLHEIRAEADGYDLGLYARATLASQLEREAPEIFDLTRRGLEFYGRQFGLAFPQQRYDQVFMPEFAGAMENYGCITYTDSLLYREAPSYAERELRAMVVLHEMAHMWFGDLVTMRWWDDLWLNESFAQWACTWCATAATEFTDIWAGTLVGDKLQAYAADRAPTTHPIRQPIPDTAAAAASFDNITYPKGAAVLKQLVAYVGEDSFVAALKTYFARYAWQNTTLEDLVREIEQASGLDLGEWVSGWLETSGVDRLTLQRADQVLSVLAESPGSRAPLPHRLDVGAYVEDAGALTLRETLAVQVDGEVTEVGAVEPAALLLVNDGDLTYASVRPDEESLSRLVASGGRLPTALGRSLAVATVWDLVFVGELPAVDLVRCVREVLPHEDADSVIEPVLQLAVEAADFWSPPEQREGLLSDLADLSISLADQPSRQLAAVRALARTATSPAQLEELQRRAGTTDLRWRRLTRLAELDALADEEVERLLAEDRNPESWASAEIARAAAPRTAAKQWAWDQAVGRRRVPVSMMGRMGAAFWRPGQSELLEPFAQAYLDALPAMGSSGMTWAMSLTGNMFPKAGADEQLADRLEQAAAGPDVTVLVAKRVLERLDRLRRMLIGRRAGSA